MIIHKLNSTSDKVLRDLKSLIGSDDIIVLIEDAVYLPYYYPEKLDEFKSHKIYVIEYDVTKRGLSNSQFKINLINYEDLVDLSQNSKMLSWFDV
ncbi:DsrH/TusB family sulfur relay protein [Thiotrichales bacterium 19S9-12]|nr:DsrH/TusB family sulfur relay protein [Thiotrichales bacterium 19S9-11]MCF6812384.1 DsrH/TusB family sulfur relay protein [Thiotrichales bacterium 19S9-12]